MIDNTARDMMNELAEIDRLHAALKRARELGEHRLGDSLRAEIVSRRRELRNQRRKDTRVPEVKHIGEER